MVFFVMTCPDSLLLIMHLKFTVPPTFVEEATSSDLDIREDLPISLRCTAKGRPQPEIFWRREDGGEIILNNQNHNSSNKNSGECIFRI